MKRFSLLCYLFCSLLFATAQQTEIKLDWLASAPVYLNGGAMIVNDIAIGKDGSIVATGNFFNTVDFDPGPDTFNVHASGYSDIFIVKYSKAGQLVYEHHFGEKNLSNSTAYGITLDDEDNVYITGKFNLDIDFDPGPGTALLSAGGTEAFIASYDKKGFYRNAIKVTSTSAFRNIQTAKSIAVDALHNVYITGSFSGKADFDPGPGTATLTAAGGLDIFLAKYDKNGKYLFAKSMGGYVDEEANKISLDKSNNIVICGYFISFAADFNPGTDTALLTANGQEDIFFAKYDSLGNYLFAKGIGGAKYDRANAVATGTDNSIVITGHFAGNKVDFDPGLNTFLLSSPGRAYECFVAKYDKNGNFVFAFQIGTDLSDDGADIDVDDANNIVVIGTFSGSEVDFDPGAGVYNLSTKHGEDNFIAKYTAAGAFVFADGIGNSNYTKNYSYTNINCVQTDNHNNIFTGGGFADTLDVDPGRKASYRYEPALSLLISNYNANGDYINSVNAGNYFYYYSHESSVTSSVIDEDGNVYITGLFNGLFDFDNGPGVYPLESLHDYYSSGYIAKYNKRGKIVFAKAIIGYEIGMNDIAIDKDQNIYICGNSSGIIDFNPSDSVHYLDNGSFKASSPGHFFAKYTNTGGFVFAKTIYNAGIGNTDVASSIVVDKSKNIYVAGYFSRTLDFDPGPDKHILQTIGYEDIYYSKYDSAGNYLFAYNIGAPNGIDNLVTDIQLNSKGNILISGSVSGDGYDFDPGPGQFLLSTKRATAGYLASYKSDGSFLGAFILTSNTLPTYMSIQSMTIDASDNMYIAGDFAGLVDFDPGNDSVYIPAERGLYFASYTNTGVLRFAKGSYTPQYEGYAAISSIATDKNKNLYAAGCFFNRQIDCDMGPDSAILVNDHYEGEYANSELFLSKYDSDGNYVYSYNLDGDSAVGANGVSAINVDKKGNIYYTGYGKTKTDFDPGTDSVFLQPDSQFSNLFVVKYSPVFTSKQNKRSSYKVTAIGIIKPANRSDLTLYPNPASDHIAVTIKNLQSATGKAKANIYNAQGVRVILKQLTISGYTINATINLYGLSKGAYFLKIIAGMQAYKIPFLIQ